MKVIKKKVPIVQEPIYEEVDVFISDDGCEYPTEKRAKFADKIFHEMETLDGILLQGKSISGNITVYKTNTDKEFEILLRHYNIKSDNIKSGWYTVLGTPSAKEWVGIESDYDGNCEAIYSEEALKNIVREYINNTRFLFE